MRNRRDRATRPWYLYLLAAVAVVVIVLAVTEIGPPTSSARTSTEDVTAADGVVQSTVSGSGNVEPATNVTVNFATSGTLEDVFVSVGQHVTQGQLLATLNPSSAQLSLDEAESNLTAAEDNLTAAEDGTSTSSGTAQASYQGASATTDFVSYKKTTATTTTPTPTKTTPGRRSPSGSAPTRTVTVTVMTPTTPGTTGSGRSGTGASTGTNTTTKTTTSPAQIASAKASVDSAEANVKSAQQALADTKLYAPASGTIASLESVSPGQTISSSGSASSGTGGSSSSSSSSSSSGTGGFAGSQSAGSLGSSSSSSSSSSTGFAEIINSSTMTMTVAFSESDISSVHVGQAATISIDALSGVELGAHVTSISPVGTSSSGVVSYNATITLDQNNSQVRPGMSATATVITGQAQGVTVPNQAISGAGSTGTVQLVKNGQVSSQQVVVGLRGTSRTEIVSGLSAGDVLQETITLPSLGTTSTSNSSGSGTLGGTGLGGGAGAFLRGAGGGGFPGGGGGFFRGGG